MESPSPRLPSCGRASQVGLIARRIGHRPDDVRLLRPYYSFEASRDLLGDRSIRLLPTPGHAEGHLSVLARMEGYQLLITGDTLYTLRHLAVDEVRQVMLGKRMPQSGR